MTAVEGGRQSPAEGPRLSIAVITLNEEERLRPCLESVVWADEIVVVDAGSSDKTVDIAREFTDRVLFRAWTGYGPQKNFAVEQCTGEWILSLDADERVPESLRDEVRAVTAGRPSETGFWVARRNVFGGRVMWHGGLYPDYQLRLLRQGRARFSDRAVHESAAADGPTGHLRGSLVHESYRGVADFLARTNRYSDLAATELALAGRGGAIADLALRPVWRFLSMYVLRAGFLDGWRGFVLAALYAHYVFVRAAKTRELLVAKASAAAGDRR